MDQSFDLRALQRAFSRAASSYREHAWLQSRVETELLSRLAFVTSEPRRVLDLGCGPGTASVALRKRFPRAQIVCLDLAMGMLREVRPGFLRPLQRVQAQAEGLPFVDGVFDVVFSSLCLQWCADLHGVFGELRRVLSPQGFLFASTFGPDTLHELRSAWEGVDATPHVSQFVDVQVLGDVMLSRGLRNPVLDRDTFVLTYTDVRSALQDVRRIGASNADDARHRGLTGPRMFSRMSARYEAQRIDGRIPSTYEVLYLQAQGAAPGTPLRRGVDEEVSVPVSQIRRRVKPQVD
jgi:malonyl-CoA O-methyltransferase